MLSLCSNFHHPFAPPVDNSRKSDGIPAPNSYDINVCGVVCVCLHLFVCLVE